MYSVRQMRESLLGVQLGAASDSLWSIGATITDRANAALVSALRQYPFRVTGAYTSLAINTRSVALPKDVDRVVSVTRINTSTHQIIPIRDVLHQPTTFTNILIINQHNVSSAEHLEIQFERVINDFPPGDVQLLSALSATATVAAINYAAHDVKGTWPENGFFEVYNSLHREVCHYTAVNQTTITGLTRSVEGGLYPGETEWPIGSVISFVPELPEAALPVLVSAAEAEMYSYWQVHRALYTQYVAVAGIAQIDLTDIVALVRVCEARAEKRYRRVRNLPAPGIARSR